MAVARRLRAQPGGAWLSLRALGILGAALLSVAQTPPAPTSAADGAGLCGSSSTITWSPGGLEPTSGNRDTAVDTLTVCNGEPISAGGALVAIDCAYYDDLSVSISLPLPIGMVAHACAGAWVRGCVGAWV